MSHRAFLMYVFPIGFKDLVLFLSQTDGKSQKVEKTGELEQQVNKLTLNGDIKVDILKK